MANYPCLLQPAQIECFNVIHHKKRANIEPVDLSVITVCLNSAPTIEKTIESIISQKGVSIEYIVIDGGSTDGTISILSKYFHVIDLLVQEPDLGVFDAMNKGIQLSTGPYIMLLNSDDRLLPNTFERYIALTKDFPEAIIHGPIIAVSERESTTWGLYPGLTPDIPEFNHPSWLVPASIYRKYGGYRSDLRVSGDFEIFLRFWFAGLTFKSVGEACVVFSCDGLSSGFKGYAEDLAICFRYLNYINAVRVVLRWYSKKTVKFLMQRILGFFGPRKEVF